MQDDVVFNYDKEPKTIEKVLEQVQIYIHSEKSIALIKKAYEFAKIHHEGQFRKSGEPYIQHPLEVAYMLACLQSGPSTISAGFLHDVVEDTGVSIDEITKIFGKDVSSIVDGVTKISQLKYMTKQKALAKTHQKMLLAMAKDIRVILVKLVDRVHNMRTLEFQPVEKQRIIAKETLDLYAPLAHKLGMYRVKAELEDLGFKYFAPEDYLNINNLITEHKKAKTDDINKIKTRIVEILKDNNITNYQIKGRVKNKYSVWKKMNEKDKSFEQIYDLLAVRIIVPSIEDCYHVLGLIHGEWTPIPLRFKDYIATPKPNLYQSLHTTVVGLNGLIYEIQIRTYEMDTVAEIGIAAHWNYKEENKSYTPEKEQAELSEKLKWYKELLTYVEIGEESDNDPLQNIQEDIFSANVYVFTPKGDVIEMPNGATPLDFAYRIHTEVGNRTVGAIVNNKIVPLTYKLKNGDVIEIRTNKNFNGPTEAWLKICKTAHAKHKIISILNKRKRDEFILKGEQDFLEIMKTYNNVTQLTDKLISDNFSKYNLNNVEDFYYEIGKGTISEKGAYNKLFVDETVTDEMLLKQYSDNNRIKKHTNNFGIVIDGLDKAQIRVASCCHPIIGDPIVGYVTKGNGIIVHRYECPNVKNASTERFIDVYWDEDNATKLFETVISILSYDRHNILTEIINVLNSATISISSINNTHTKDGELLTKVKMMVKDLNQLENAISNLNKISDIYSIERVMK